MASELTEKWAAVEEMTRAALAGIGVAPGELKADSIDTAKDGAPLPALIHEPTGLTLCAVDEYKADDGGLVTGFLASGCRVIPGCRTLPNGDPGYPDDVDVFDIQTWTPEEWGTVPADFARLVAQHLIDGALERWQENKWAEDYAEPDETDKL